MVWMKKIGLLLTVYVMCCFTGEAQVKKISGTIRDKQSDEPIPFASVVFSINKRGVQTDSAGYFILELTNVSPKDSIQIFSVGYRKLVIPLSRIPDSLNLSFKIEVLPPDGEAIVKSKYNRSLWFWRKIMAHKEMNNRTRWDSYSYEIYNKLEMDLNNVRAEKLQNNILLKPLKFVFSYVDSAENSKPYLPVYLSETLSDYYYQKSPERIHEVIKAVRTNGVENESLIKELGGMYQNVNVYNNFIPVFDKEFISPFNTHGDNYYNFKLADTAYLRGKRLVHLRFTAKRKGENTFEGDCWVNDTSFALQKVTMRPSPDANINFIEGLSIIQEYRLINDSIWFLYKDRFVADIAPIANGRLGIKGRKTATYEHVILNDTVAVKDLKTTIKIQQVDLMPDKSNLPDSFWVHNRHEPLNKDENTVYKVLDTLTKNPTYIFYRDLAEVLVKGTKDYGNIRIGPWFNWLSANNREGYRFRFDLSTNNGFNKKLFLTGYMAYGTKDGLWKGGGEAKYIFDKLNWSYLKVGYKYDLDNGQMYYNQLGTDNLLATIFRRPNIPFKFQQLEQKSVEYFKETKSGFGYGISGTSKKYTALENLPGKEYFTSKGTDPFNTFETQVHLRFAYLERNLVDDAGNRYSLGTVYPIVDFRYTKGINKVIGSNYDYDKFDLSVSQTTKISPYGTLFYNLFAGKVNGTIPYQMLDIIPGNEMYYFNRYAFNLMNRFEYLADQYAGFTVEHNFGTGIFKFFPLTRKLKFRQFWTARGVTGTLTDENKQLNFVGNYPYRSLDNKWYVEVGTGVDNILKFFRVDLVWRVVSPEPINGTTRNHFGVFGSFRLAF
jgi:hypothetical protein